MGKLKTLDIFNLSAFLKAQVLLLPVLYLFYLMNGLTWSDYFLFQGIAVLVNVILQFPVGILGNYVQRKHLITTSYVLFLGRIFLWFFFKGYWIILIGEILGAISKSLFDAVESPYIYDVLQDNHKENEMTKSYGKLNFSISCGTAIASILGTLLYDRFGVQILLGTEFIIMSIAIMLALKLPCTDATTTYNYSIKKVKVATRHIIKSKLYLYPILISGILVSFSHFFFWSFQPLMKLAKVPLLLFGAIIFINNIIRALASFYTNRIIKYISISKLSIIAFTLDITGLLLLMYIQKYELLSPKICLLFILFLCICIAFQLMFTIRTTSYLQEKAPNRLRGYIASSNMFIARLSTAIILIMPKYLSLYFSLIIIYNIYLYILLFLGTVFLVKFLINIKAKFNPILIAGLIIISLFVGIKNDHIFSGESDSICIKKLLHQIDNNIINIQYYDGIGDVWLANDLLLALQNDGFNAVKVPYSDDHELTKKCMCADYNLNLMDGIHNNEKLINKKIPNILWLIYPKDISDYDKYINKFIKVSQDYDAVFVSSKKIYNSAKDKINKPFYYIPQFTNTQKFHYDYDESLKSELLFVGTYYFERKAPTYALIHNLPVTIYGGRWPEGIAKAEYIDNRILRKYYSSAKIVLNDTTDIMKETDFVSNRIFDATACGTLVISDYSPAVEEIYGDSVPTWKTEEEFVKLVNYYLTHPKEREEKAKRAQQITLSKLTSDKVVPEIVKVIKEIK